MYTPTHISIPLVASRRRRRARHNVLILAVVVHPAVDARELVAHVAVERVELQHVARVPRDVRRKAESRNPRRASLIRCIFKLSHIGIGYRAARGAAVSIDHCRIVAGMVRDMESESET